MDASLKPAKSEKLKESPASQVFPMLFFGP